MTRSVTGDIFPRLTDSNPSRKPYTFCDLEFDSFGEAPNPTRERVRTQRAGSAVPEDPARSHDSPIRASAAAAWILVEEIPGRFR
jgi:hypothetical protein